MALSPEFFAGNHLYLPRWGMGTTQYQKLRQLITQRGGIVEDSLSKVTNFIVSPLTRKQLLSRLGLAVCSAVVYE